MRCALAKSQAARQPRLAPPAPGPRLGQGSGVISPAPASSRVYTSRRVIDGFKSEAVALALPPVVTLSAKHPRHDKETRTPPPHPPCLAGS